MQFLNKSIPRMWISGRCVLLRLTLAVFFASALLLSHSIYETLHPTELTRGDFVSHASHGLSLGAESTYFEDPEHIPHSSGFLCVQGIVSFPDDVMLLVRMLGKSSLPKSENLECVFGGNQRTTVYRTEWKDSKTVLLVKCGHPSLAPDQHSTLATLNIRDSMFTLPSIVKYTTSNWKVLVYETLVQPDEVILFVKGLLDSNGKPNNFSDSLHDLTCVFKSEFRTPVRSVAQEVVHCDLPPKHLVQQYETRITLAISKIGILPSVATFKSQPSPQQLDRTHFLCACTMLWNQARFLREWIMYHGFLGVEKWFIYDNNSDDDIEAVLEELAHYNVSRHYWPWIKTQEAGFSHCALRAKEFCEWVMFMDVDEFIYPQEQLKKLARHASPLDLFSTKASANVRAERMVRSSSVNILKQLILRQVQKANASGKPLLGELRFMCHNFGPSGLSRTPEAGVIASYNCRMRWPERHKSILRLDALSDSLRNEIHHFDLRDGYSSMAVYVREGVVNHYKYQTWDVFKAKFVRRVATYVIDWAEQQNATRDRAPGLGTEAVEPPDWQHMFCEENDTGLMTYALNTFKDHQSQQMVWQIPPANLKCHSPCTTWI